MHILTDFPRFPERTLLPDGSEVTASRKLTKASPKDLLGLIPDIRKTNLILVQDSALTMGLVLLFFLRPSLRKPIIGVDLIFRRPRTFKQKVIARLKRILLKRVDHFIHYFQMLNGYEKYYGISHDRSSYVPFKSNMHGNPKVANLKLLNSEEFVFSAGRSLRDYDTLFDALAQVGYPAAIPKPHFQLLQLHGSRFTRKIEDLPKNLVLLEDDGTPESWLRNLHRAKVVVIPTLSDSLCASGIGTYVDAMSIKKCVIISAGPGVSDLLRDEAIIVPPEDSVALADAIRRVWEDTTLRSETAQRGYQYAAALGGEPELMNRLLKRAFEWYRNTGRNGSSATAS